MTGGDGRPGAPNSGCDVRGAGGYVVGPRAVLPDGRGWIHVAERPPVTQAAQLAWIESILRRPAEPPHDHPAGETSDQRGRAYAEQALHEIEAELAVIREGERNERLYTRRPFGSAPWRRAAGSPKPRSGTRCIVRASPMGCSKTTVRQHFSARSKAGSATASRFRTRT